MARPERRNADYFPFYAKDGRTLFLLENKYQCKGTGFFTNVMRFLTLETNHYVNIQDETDRMYFFSKCHCDEESGMDMLNIMAKTGKINNELWGVMIIASQDLLDSLVDAYRNRINSIITVSELIQKYVSCVINDVSNVINDVSDINKPQRKGKETKLKETKKTFLSDSNEIRLSKLLFSFIKERDTKAREPNYQKWATHIDRLIRIDGREPLEIEDLIKRSQEDSFWRNNILSTEKLRKQFTQVLLRTTEELKKGGTVSL